MIEAWSTYRTGSAERWSARQLARAKPERCRVSVVLPAHNEESRIDRTLRDYRAALELATAAGRITGVTLRVFNPIGPGLTGEQVVAIYTGQLRNWSEVSGRDAPITVVNKAEGRAELFKLNKQVQELQARAVKAKPTVKTAIQKLMKDVVKHQQAIGKDITAFDKAAVDELGAAKAKLLQDLAKLKATIATMKAKLG